MTALLNNNPNAWPLDARPLNEAVSAVVQTALAKTEQECVLSGEVSPFRVQARGSVLARPAIAGRA
ncbi:MAG: hypothetical protein NXI21_12075 [Alphaproteobacteria bacterium]|nr:hypothetical protein [Alphaproteobacteria bacterium]